MIAIRISGISRPTASARTPRWNRPRFGRRHAHRHVRNQEGAEDEGVADEEHPHHRLAPGHVLECALIGRPVGNDTLHARLQRGAASASVRSIATSFAMVPSSSPDAANLQQQLEIVSTEQQAKKHQPYRQQKCQYSAHSRCSARSSRIDVTPRHDSGPAPRGKATSRCRP